MAPLQPKAGHLGLILPLCTSSATVGLALFQYPVFLSFLQAKDHSIAGKPLSFFWDPFLKQAGTLIAGLCIGSAVAGGFSARWLRTHVTLETTEVSQWYIYGTALAAGHLAFVPIVAGPIRRMIDANNAPTDAAAEKTNREEMKTWLTIHTARTLLVDLPALWCFAEGAALSFWVTH